MSDVNFLPEDYVEKKAQQRTNFICLALFFLVMAGVAGGMLVTEKRQKTMNIRQETVKKKFVKATESLKKLETLEKKKKQMMDKALVSASLMETVPRSLLVATVTNDLPSGVSLLNYEMVSKVQKQKVVRKSKQSKSRSKKRSNQSKAEEPKKEIKPEKYETSIEIEGLAGTDLQVAKFIAQLNRCSMFEQINLIFSEEHENKEQIMRRFKLLVSLNVDAKASEEDVALVKDMRVTGM